MVFKSLTSEEKVQLARQMDEAALQAENDEFLLKNAQAFEIVAHWWQQHYMKAGHKRLGRILVRTAKALKTEGGK